MQNTGTASNGGDRPRRVLQMPALHPALVAKLDTEFHAITLPATPAERATFLSEHAGAIDVLVTSGGIGAQADIIHSLPELRAIVNVGVGFDSIDLDAARARQIAVSNTPGVLDDCVADLALGLLIDVFRQISAADRFVRRGEWPGEEYPLMMQFSGSRVGIVGLGRIGRAIARRLEAFGIDIMYYSRRPVEDCGYTYVADIVDLAGRCNALVVSTAGGPDSRQLISRKVLEALAGGFLVNISRGSVVDEEALVELLQTGHLAGAGLDVFEREPQVPKALFELDNVVIVPHIGSATHNTRAAMIELALQNLTSYLAEGKLVTPV
jgi:lactate dehydrogenase-like 2-hydroxyacid dehydrogenase